MDREGRLCADVWGTSSSSPNSLPKKVSPALPPSSNFSFNYGLHFENQYPNSKLSSQIPSPLNGNVTDQAKIHGWDPKLMLSNLSLMEQKIRQLKDLVHLIVAQAQKPSSQPSDILAQQQQLITTDLTSIIVQLISTAGSLLPLVKQTSSCSNPSLGQLSEISFPPANPDPILLPNSNPSINSNSNNVNKAEDQSDEFDLSGNYGVEQIYGLEDQELKEDDDVDEGENLPPGSYEILQLEKEEILAPHTHFCMICGKGFKRDANLRMHMRGHGDEYKTPEALAKPHKELSSEPVLPKRYSCPCVGCKRNKDHKKFQPLKTILCVKNHYKRTHCDKSYTCSRCHTKKFSVIADLKTHEKHCGIDKWLCSCGTTFSRKDKLFGHIALFQGHTPAIALDEGKGAGGLSDCGENGETPNKIRRQDFNFSSENGILSTMNMKEEVAVDGTSLFSAMNFDACNLSGLAPFQRPPFEDSESFSFLFPGACNYSWKNGGESGSNIQQ